MSATTSKRGSTSRRDKAPGRLFDVTTSSRRPMEGTFEYVPLEHIRLAKNPRRDISSEGLDRLARMVR
jgi:hypothetical protein